MLVRILYLVLGTILSSASFAESEYVSQYKAFAEEAGLDVSVSTDLQGFFEDVNERLLPGEVILIEMLGFSGAGYSDIDLYLTEVDRRLSRALAKASTAKNLVIVLGGSVDGFGAAYEYIHKLHAAGELGRKKLILGGLVSDKVVKYHLEGIEKGWGDVISPLHSVLMLRNTYTKEDGSRSWELKDSPEGKSDTVALLTEAPKQIKQEIKHIEMQIYEGGTQAFKEGVEFLMEATLVPNSNFQLSLSAGFEPKKAKKDKGYRAARQLALWAIMNERQLPGNVEFQVSRAVENENDWKLLTVKEASVDISHLAFVTDVSNPLVNKIRFEIDGVAEEVVSDFQARLTTAN